MCVLCRYVQCLEGPKRVSDHLEPELEAAVSYLRCPLERSKSH